MPIYEFECKDHGVFELILKMDIYNNFSCPKCSNPSPKIVSRPAVIADNFEKSGVNGHYDIGTDQHYTSKKQYYDTLKSKGYGVYEPGIKQISKDERLKKASEATRPQVREAIKKTFEEKKIKIY